jgi:hypothetical protein
MKLQIAARVERAVYIDHYEVIPIGSREAWSVADTIQKARIQLAEWQIGVIQNRATWVGARGAVQDTDLEIRRIWSDGDCETVGDLDEE